MSDYRELVEEFFTRYEHPEVDELVVGFSGIDPPKKQTDGEIDHERLDSLLGGSHDDGHYHLTLDEWQAVKRLLDTPEYDGGYARTTEAEYRVNQEYWLDGGYSDSEQEDAKDGGDAQE